MKKLVIISFCVACISVSAIAQPGVRIGNLEFIVRKTENDTVAQINLLDPCPPCPSEKETRPKANPYRYHHSNSYGGIGFILPDDRSGYYTTLGGKSINFDCGGMHRYQLARRFALGGTFRYSYYNYKLYDAADEPEFKQVVLKGRDYDPNSIRKQVYRSHNLAAGVFTRFYIVPPKKRGNDGFYIDLGAQGDFAFSKYYKIKIRYEGRDKIRNDLAFNPFNASAIARVGWRGWGGSKDSYAIFVRYRITDAFNQSQKALSMDLPPITIGIQFF
jgi:hypothetical protein